MAARRFNAACPIRETAFRKTSWPRFSTVTAKAVPLERAAAALGSAYRSAVSLSACTAGQFGRRTGRKAARSSASQFPRKCRGRRKQALAIRLSLQPFDGLGWVAEDPLTPTLSQQARLGELAVQVSRIRLRMGRVRQQKRPITAKACLRGEGQDEGGLREAIKRVWHHQSSESGSSVVLFTSEIAIEEFVNCTEAAWLRCLRKNAS